MKRILTLIVCAISLNAVGQVPNYLPYNPDFENDGFVGIEDVLELLAVYGTPFTPEQLLLDGASLTEIIESLQSQIDSLASFTNEGFGAIALNDSLLTEYLVGVAAASEEGDSTLGAWVMQLSELVEQQQAQIDSLALGNNLGQFNMGLSEHLSLQEQATQFYGLNWFHFEFEDDGFLTASTTEHSFFFRIPKTVEVDFSDEQFLAALFDSTNGYPANEGMGTYTIPLSSQEQLILAFDTQDENPFAYWTPLTSATTEVDDPIQTGPCQGEFTVNYHGYDYELVEIGGKCWFAEDLQTAHFTNDDQIAFAPDINYSVANSVDVPVYALAFDQNSEQNGEYGKLYNYPAVLDPRGLCPSGWIVSSADNWEDLKGWVSINTWFPNANALKSESDWSPPSNGLDLFGFNAKPSGHYTQGACYGGQQANSIGIWWTSTESNVSGQTYIMESDYDEINSYDGGCSPNVCFAVRCVKD